VDDAERLIAEALRAQAARTPLPSAETTQRNAAPGLGLAGSGYGLLSGSDLPLARPVETARVGGGTTTRRIEPPPRASAAAILLLALMLGLAAGAVVGLLTLL
jgi:hypothetical protein